MKKKLYMSPMVKTIKLSTEVAFLAGSGETEPGAGINPREGEVNDPMAKGGGPFDDIDFLEEADFISF
jgi:hypothetical protein